MTIYRTPSGSTVKVQGERSGDITVDFDWFAEPHACMDCVPNIDDTRDGGFDLLHWDCEYCNGGVATLTPDAE